MGGQVSFWDGLASGREQYPWEESTRAGYCIAWIGLDWIGLSEEGEKGGKHTNCLLYSCIRQAGSFTVRETVDLSTAQPESTQEVIGMQIGA